MCWKCTRHRRLYIRPCQRVLESNEYIRVHDRAFDIIHIIDNVPCCLRDGTQTALVASVKFRGKDSRCRIATYERSVDDPEFSRLDNDTCRSGGFALRSTPLPPANAHRHIPTSEQRNYFTESHTMTLPDL